MGGPVTKTLAQMQEEARTTGFVGRPQKPLLFGMGGPQGPQFPGMGGLRPAVPSQLGELMRRYAQPGQDYRTVSDQQIQQMQQMEMEQQKYAQMLEQQKYAAELAAMGGRPPYDLGPGRPGNPFTIDPGRQPGTGMPGFGGDPRFPGVMPPQQDSYKAYMDDFMRKSQENSMNPYAPQISPMSSDGFRQMFPNGYTPGSMFGPGNPPMPSQIMGGPANKMGPQTGMPQFANPYAREFMGLGQAAANQMGLGQAAAAASQRAMPRPQQRPTPGNYGGYNSIQGMGANQYGGFNSPPPGMGQMGMGQAAQQQPQTQNNMFGSFGGFGQAMGGGQNQGPNQQAQQEDQYGNFGGGSNQGGGGGGLF